MITALFLEKVDQHLSKLLLPNGFTRLDEKIYHNDKCVVRIGKGGYEVYDKEDQGSIYSEGFVIYWLVGLLIWNGYIDRNFKIP